MKRLQIVFVTLIVAIVAGTGVLAHGKNEHVRGVVTSISPKSITVQTTDKATRTLALTSKTTFQRAGKTAQLVDLKVGDRVVVDVPEKTSDALLVQIGTAAAVAPTAAEAPQAEAPKKFAITLKTTPEPPNAGENTVDVLVKDATGKPIADADVSLLVVMPAMPTMPGMKSEVTLKATGDGKYTGAAKMGMVGEWNVTVSVKQGGKEIGKETVKLTTK